MARYRVVARLGRSPWLVVLMSTIFLLGCSDAESGWDKPFDDTTCDDYRGERTTPQRVAMAGSFLAEFRAHGRCAVTACG